VIIVSKLADALNKIQDGLTELDEVVNVLDTEICGSRKVINVMSLRDLEQIPGELKCEAKGGFKEYSKKFMGTEFVFWEGYWVIESSEVA